jgi:hypothetical protein
LSGLCEQISDLENQRRKASIPWNRAVDQVAIPNISHALRVCYCENVLERDRTNAQFVGIIYRTLASKARRGVLRSVL